MLRSGSPATAMTSARLPGWMALQNLGFASHFSRKAMRLVSPIQLLLEVKRDLDAACVVKLLERS